MCRIFAGGLWALTSLAWQYSTHAEVFALNNALIAAIEYLSVRYVQTGDKRYSSHMANALMDSHYY